MKYMLLALVVLVALLGGTAFAKTKERPQMQFQNIGGGIKVVGSQVAVALPVDVSIDLGPGEYAKITGASAIVTTTATAGNRQFYFTIRQIDTYTLLTLRPVFASPIAPSKTANLTTRLNGAPERAVAGAVATLEEMPFEEIIVPNGTVFRFDDRDGIDRTNDRASFLITYEIWAYAMPDVQHVVVDSGVVRVTP